MSQAKEVLSDGREVGEVATRVLFENNRVRVWAMDLAPGESTELHRHEHDYVQVEVLGDKLKGIIEPGAGGTYTTDIEVDCEPGRVFWVDKGGFETAKNIGKERYLGILIELKD